PIPGLQLLDVAMNRDGELYALDAATDSLVKLNPQTGTVLTTTAILGLDVLNEPQTIEFDDSTNTLYWMARSNASPYTQFRRLALDGASPVIQTLWASPYVCLAAINGGQPDVSWLNLSTTQGTLIPGQSLTVDVLLDPDAFDMPPGVYHANLMLLDNAPDTPNQKRHGKIPVILTITEPTLSITAPAQAFEGDTLPITLSFDADGAQTGHPIADAAEIVVDLPTGFSLVNGSLTADYGTASYNAGTHQISWQTPSPLETPPEVVTLTYQLTVNSGTHSQTLSQQAELSYSTYTKTTSAETQILNRAPQLEQPLPDQQAIVQHSFTYSIPVGSFSDADADTLTYSATGLPAGLSLSSSGTFSGAPQQSGSFTITVRASDPFGAYAEDSFTLTVLTALYLPGIQR
nr:putative Ig domain-containing protein [Longilinea sp.]